MLSYETESPECSDSSEVCRDLYIHYVRWLIIRTVITTSLLVAPESSNKTWQSLVLFSCILE